MQNSSRGAIRSNQFVIHYLQESDSNTTIISSNTNSIITTIITMEVGKDNPLLKRWLIGIVHLLIQHSNHKIDFLHDHLMVRAQ